VIIRGFLLEMRPKLPNSTCCSRSCFGHKCSRLSGLEERHSACQDVHIFLGRGNNEPVPGRKGKIVDAICSGLGSCDFEDFAMDNTLESNYCTAVTQGADNGTAQITAYNKRCPDSTLVVSGYSQGGQVVGDILGGGGCVQPDNSGLDPSTLPGSNSECLTVPKRKIHHADDCNPVAAALISANVRHTANQPYNVQVGAGDNGLYPRT
jgi:hypothetical protein